MFRKANFPWSTTHRVQIHRVQSIGCNVQRDRNPSGPKPNESKIHRVPNPSGPKSIGSLCRKGVIGYVRYWGTVGRDLKPLLRCIGKSSLLL